jgi:hypothetical protein
VGIVFARVSYTVSTLHSGPIRGLYDVSRCYSLLRYSTGVTGAGRWTLSSSSGIGVEALSTGLIR